MLSASAASLDGKIDSTELFHDQGPLFCSALEPGARDSINLSLRCLRDDVSSAELKYFDEAGADWHVLPMKKTAGPGSSRYELWSAIIPAGKSRKHYHFVLHDGGAAAYYDAFGSVMSESKDHDFMIRPDFATPKWLGNGVIYQIFPDRFFDGEPQNNIKSNQYTFAGSPTIQRSWGESPIARKGENVAMTFYGGDLAGVLAKLSYIRERLGANIVYLNPIFEAPSNHKYDTSDYDQVAQCLGSKETLITLARALHEPALGKHGYLILDAVFNHTGDSHKWFGKYSFRRPDPSIKGAYESQKSPFYSYYSFSKWPDKFATFLDVKSLPKLNYGSAALRNEIYSGRDPIALRYLRSPYKIDGWRLDAPQYVDSGGKQGIDSFDHMIWRQFRKTIKGAFPEAVILGENWQDASSWLSPGDQWDSVTNFDGFTNPVSEWLTGVNYDDKPAKLSVSEFDRWLRLTRAHYPANVQRCLSNHLSNHDISRFAERARGDEGIVSLALTFQMTYLGVPTIYYGDEYGMRGGRDPDDRRTFDWAKDDGKNSLIALAHKLIQLRDKYAALRSGSFISLDLDDRDNVYAFGRMDKHNRIAVILNADSSEHDLPVSVYRLEVADGAAMVDALSGKSYEVREGLVHVTLAPRGAAILVQDVH